MLVLKSKREDLREVFLYLCEVEQKAVLKVGEESVQLEIKDYDFYTLSISLRPRQFDLFQPEEGEWLVDVDELKQFSYAVKNSDYLNWRFHDDKMEILDGEKRVKFSKQNKEFDRFKSNNYLINDEHYSKVKVAAGDVKPMFELLEKTIDNDYIRVNIDPEKSKVVFSSKGDTDSLKLKLGSPKIIDSDGQKMVEKIDPEYLYDLVEQIPDGYDLEILMSEKKFELKITMIDGNGCLRMGIPYKA